MAKKIKGGYVPKSMQKASMHTHTLAPTAEELKINHKTAYGGSSKLKHIG